MKDENSTIQKTQFSRIDSLVEEIQGAKQELQSTLHRKEARHKQYQTALKSIYQLQQELEAPVPTVAVLDEDVAAEGADAGAITETSSATSPTQPLFDKEDGEEEEDGEAGHA